MYTRRCQMFDFVFSVALSFANLTSQSLELGMDFLIFHELGYINMKSMKPISSTCHVKFAKLRSTRRRFGLFDTP